MSYGIKANISASHQFLRMGSLCWLHNYSISGRIQITGMSRGGRKVKTWAAPKILSNFRVGWIENNPPFPLSDKFPFEQK
jgi:hypothetical protein